MILPKPEIAESETSAKRRRKPVSKFDDFVLDNSTKKLISASDLRKNCSKDEIRLIQLHLLGLIRIWFLTIIPLFKNRLNCHNSVWMTQ